MDWVITTYAKALALEGSSPFPLDLGHTHKIPFYVIELTGHFFTGSSRTGKQAHRHQVGAIIDAIPSKVYPIHMGDLLWLGPKPKSLAGLGAVHRVRAPRIPTEERGRAPSLLGLRVDQAEAVLRARHTAYVVYLVHDTRNYNLTVIRQSPAAGAKLGSRSVSIFVSWPLKVKHG